MYANSNFDMLRCAQMTGEGFIQDFVLGREYFVMLLPGTRSMPRGVRVTHATLGGSGGMLPQELFLKTWSSEVDSNGFWGVLLHPCVSKIKILGGGGNLS